MPAIPERLRPGDTVALIAPASAPPIQPPWIARSQCWKPWASASSSVETPGSGGATWPAMTGNARAISCACSPTAVCRLSFVCGAAMERPGFCHSWIIKPSRPTQKIFVGCSDITSLHGALSLNSRLLTFHGPMPASDFLRKDCPDFSRASLLRVLMEPKAAGRRAAGILRENRRGSPARQSFG